MSALERASIDALLRQIDEMVKSAELVVRPDFVRGYVAEAVRMIRRRIDISEPAQAATRTGSERTLHV